MKNKNFAKISLIYYLSTIIVCVLFILGYLGVIKNDVLASTLIQIVTMLAIPMLLYTLLVSKNAKQTLKDTGIKKVNIKVICLCFILGVCLYFFNAFIAGFFASILNKLGWENLYSKFGTNTVQFSYGLLLKEFVLSAILPAICEEFLHRGILLQAGKRQYNTRYCLIISSLLFGLMHLNIQQFFYATILGLIMGYVTLVADSIIPSIILHFMNNALSTYFYYGTILGWKIPTSYYNVQNSLSAKPILYVIVSTLCLMGIIFAIFYLIKAIKKETNKSKLKKILKQISSATVPIDIIKSKINETQMQLRNDKNLNINKHKIFKLKNNVFIISAFILSGLVTICTFIWGLI